MHYFKSLGGTCGYHCAAASRSLYNFVLSAQIYIYVSLTIAIRMYHWKHNLLTIIKTISQSKTKAQGRNYNTAPDVTTGAKDHFISLFLSFSLSCVGPEHFSHGFVFSCCVHVLLGWSRSPSWEDVLPTFACSTRTQEISCFAFHQVFQNITLSAVSSVRVILQVTRETKLDMQLMTAFSYLSVRGGRSCEFSQSDQTFSWWRRRRINTQSLCLFTRTLTPTCQPLSQNIRLTCSPSPLTCFPFPH